MARLTKWNYHQEDWNGKRDGWVDYMAFYDTAGNIVFNTGWRNINGTHNYENGEIGGNFTSIFAMSLRWRRDLHSNGGGYWRVWVEDDLGNKYLVLVSKFCKGNGKDVTEQVIRLDAGAMDSGWAGHGNNWRLRRVQIYNANACVSVCNCNNGNCSCRGNHTCNCNSGNCASYGCSCNKNCHSNCTGNKTFACLCNSRRDAILCSAHCTSHTCNCNANKKFDSNRAISASEINALRHDINTAREKFSISADLGSLGVQLIQERDITVTNTSLRNVYDRVKSMNPAFNYDYTAIDSTMPTNSDKYVRLDTYRRMSDLADVINSLCISHNTCASNCASHDACATRCTCNIVNNGVWKPDNYTCPCNSQCSCNGQCSGVCVNCSCNAQNTLLDGNGNACYIV